jgi:transposase
MSNQRYSPEFKDEAVRLVSDRGMTISQAARDLDIHDNVLRRWVRQYRDDPAHAFPGAGQMKPDEAEIAKLKKEVGKLKAERDILKKASAFFARESS